ncbi:hypothetical protein ANO14919_128700 [Xylariales sp. No.14919]|nr:hypothetical protein ANO14919_128700 [Xylariales sp. No.14919]
MRIEIVRVKMRADLETAWERGSMERGAWSMEHGQSMGRTWAEEEHGREGNMGLEPKVARLGREPLVLT